MPQLDPAVSPYARWLATEAKAGQRYRNASEARRMIGCPLKQYRICTDHTFSYTPGTHPRCPAKRIQAQLQRKGYYASQYQGVVTTDAPHELVMELKRR